MQATDMAEPKLSNAAPDLARDEISLTLEQNWDDMFSQDRAHLEKWQLAAARRRFEELAPQVKALKSQADSGGVSQISSLNDLVPLLFNHAAYKSYPMSLLENSRFDMLTRWLDGMTSIDLSGVNARECTGIDNWLETLERETPLQIYHTTGTTGKLSFIPRTTLERDMWDEAFLKIFERFGDEPGEKLGGPDGARVPVVFPGVRGGRYATQRIIDRFAEYVAPTPGQCYTASNDYLSADVVSLSGRVRVAQAKGDLSSMKLTEPMRLALKQYLTEMERRPQEMSEFFSRMVDKLRGERVFLIWQAAYLVRAANAGMPQGLSNIFAPNSFGNTGGGNKDLVLPDNWLNLIRDFTGIQNWEVSYGMSEMVGVLPQCPEGYYHIQPYFIPFLLDPETGAILPREGRQSGRFAALDLLAQTYWGGVISSDKVTIEWDRACGCGRKGAHIHDDIVRYAAEVTGDDKVTCSATVDNNDAALHQLLAG